MTQNFQLLLIRHAETDFAGTFCGQSDPPVNARGHAQISALLASLQPHKISVVYSSDLQRATTTGQSIAASFKTLLQITSDLREIGFGAWENLTWAQIQRQDHAYAERWAAKFPKLPAPNGEDFAAFEHRTLTMFDSIAAARQNAAVVTHAGVLSVILTRRCGLSDEQAWLQTKTYCGVFIYPGGASGL
jgi:broad specificity phosphatase PhoE